MTRKVYIKTFGCQMNVRDAEAITGMFVKGGWSLAGTPEESDCALFVGCSVRGKAEERCWQTIARLKSHKRAHPQFIVGLVGCMAKRYKTTAFDRLPFLDIVCGPSAIETLPEMVAGVQRDRQRLVKIDGTRTQRLYSTGYRADSRHAFVTITTGCQNFCSYCIVPYVRGPLRCRSPRMILDEIRDDVSRGIREVTLLGQNVNAYRFRSVDFVELLHKIDRLGGITSISFVTSHPKDTTIELFKAMQGLSKVKKYLHLPVQSGSNRILGKMGRGYTRARYLSLVDTYRKIVDGGMLSTDIIVGYPTETEKDFKETLSLIKSVQFDSAYIFKYNPRPFTAAGRLQDDVDQKEKKRRHAVLLTEQKKISMKRKAIRKKG